MMSKNELAWATRIVQEMKNLNKGVALPYEIMLLLREGEGILQDATEESRVATATRS